MFQGLVVILRAWDLLAPMRIHPGLGNEISENQPRETTASGARLRSVPKNYYRTLGTLESNGSVPGCFGAKSGRGLGAGINMLMSGPE